jgi:2-methylcitrate dehydratase PrpD
MNVFYGLAMIALEGAAFTQQFQENRLSDPRVFDFISRVRAFVDPEIDSMGPPFRHAARVRARTRSGAQHERLLLHRRGSPENPLPPEEIVYKFRKVVEPCMDKADAERIIALVDRLETLERLDELAALVAAPVRMTAARPTLENEQE